MSGESRTVVSLMDRIFLASKRFFGVPSFLNYAIADGIFNMLFPGKTALQSVKQLRLDDFSHVLTSDETQGLQAEFSVDNSAAFWLP
jgi:hypothetical protein